MEEPKKYRDKYKHKHKIIQLNKITYLFGAGSSIGECDFQQGDLDISFNGIRDYIIEQSAQEKGKIASIIKENKLKSADIDIENFISLFEKIGSTGKFNAVLNEIKKYFYDAIADKLGYYGTSYLQSGISTGLIALHKNYFKHMGKDGEELHGILTLNYDYFLESALCKTYGGVNYGNKITYIDLKNNTQSPILLKLHGSFNWKEPKEKTGIIATSKIGKYNKNKLWLSPSLNKRPAEEYKDIWDGAQKLLMKSSILRIVGCSLRPQDWLLHSLIFQAQQRNKSLKIEFVKSSKKRPKFKYFKKFDFINITESEKNTNIYYKFVVKKINEAQKKDETITNAKFIKDLI